jgi:hypothetical protein
VDKVIRLSRRLLAFVHCPTCFTLTAPWQDRVRNNRDRPLHPLDRFGIDIVKNGIIGPILTFGGVARHDARAGRAKKTYSTDAHLRASLGWLKRAQDQSPEDGVSYGYSLRGGWLPPYRETSGYIATTFYRAGDQLGDDDLSHRAERIVRWLVKVQNSDGGFANPKYGPDGIVFDTGQDLFGLVAAYERTEDLLFFNAARRAGQWLVDALGSDRMWTRFEHKATPHVYNARTAWALLRLNQIDPSDVWVTTARRNLDWAVENQQPSGFFTNNAFVAGDFPYTHNISYAICGLQESGWLLDDQVYVDAARSCSDAALALMRNDGFIPGQITPEGGQAASYSCVTGQAQLAIGWAKQFDLTHDERYRAAARSSIDFVKQHHRVHDSNPALEGAVAGSFPIWGRYAPLSYPNWASKFFVDALLLERQW